MARVAHRASGTAPAAAPSFSLSGLGKRFPFLFQLGICTAQACAGDLLIQKYVEHKEKIDWQRTSVFVRRLASRAVRPRFCAARDSILPCGCKRHAHVCCVERVRPRPLSCAVTQVAFGLVYLGGFQVRCCAAWVALRRRQCVVALGASLTVSNCCAVLQYLVYSIWMPRIFPYAKAWADMAWKRKVKDRKGFVTMWKQIAFDNFVHNPFMCTLWLRRARTRTDSAAHLATLRCSTAQTSLLSTSSSPRSSLATPASNKSSTTTTTLTCPWHWLCHRKAATAKQIVTRPGAGLRGQWSRTAWARTARTFGRTTSPCARLSSPAIS